MVAFPFPASCLQYDKPSTELTIKIPRTVAPPQNGEVYIYLATEQELVQFRAALLQYYSSRGLIPTAISPRLDQENTNDFNLISEQGDSDIAALSAALIKYDPGLFTPVPVETLSAEDDNHYIEISREGGLSMKLCHSYPAIELNAGSSQFLVIRTSWIHNTGIPKIGTTGLI